MPSLETVLQQWRLFCQKPPKGFEKYFKPGGAAKEGTKSESANKDAKKSDGSSAPPKQAPPSRGLPPPTPGPKPPDQWSFGMFGGTR